MIDFTEAVLSQLAIHRVGNKATEEPYALSSGLQPMTDDLQEVLSSYFLSDFKPEAFHHFRHDADLRLHEVYTYCANIFAKPEALFPMSVNLLKLLHEMTDHPRIKTGELYIAHFEQCIVLDEMTDAVGIFKSETKDRFLKPNVESEQGVAYEQGVNTKRLDKGCLIFNTDAEDGYRLLLVDNTSRSNAEAKFWKDKFLGASPVADEHFNTSQFLDLCSSFTKEVMATDEERDRKTEVEFLNKSMEYFNSHEAFDADTFIQETIPDDKHKAQFRRYKDEYQEKREVDLQEAFEIHPAAVKQAKRKFKNVIKLDDNVEIRIKAAEDAVEKGFDADRQKAYYKIYFDTER